MFVAINTNKSNRVMALRAMMGFNNGGGCATKPLGMVRDSAPGWAPA
jgi:hypothetical protein